MIKYLEDFTVVENTTLNHEYTLLKLKPENKLGDILPGQFVQVQVNEPGVLLRRPISIHDVDYANNTMSLLIQRVGKGSINMANAPVNSELNIMYPLGNSFSKPDGDTVLLVGGGCGIAPLLYLGRYLKDNGVTPHFLVGVRNENFLILIDKYKELGEVHITTEDGSVGTKGFVTNHAALNENANIYSKVYTCGPDPMMKAVAKSAAKHNIPCEVSLENTMACGIGACLCCVAETKSRGNVCTCTDGPIFDSLDVVAYQK